LQTRLASHVIDEKAQKIIRGGDEIKTEKYLLVLRRDRVVLEPTRKNIVEAVSCPKCGAPALINNMGHCVYCDAIIKTGNYVWFLDDIDIIWPDSRYSAGGVFINNKRTDRFKKELELNG
jgi:hypothetical protein